MNCPNCGASELFVKITATGVVYTCCGTKIMWGGSIVRPVNPEFSNATVIRREFLGIYDKDGKPL